METGQKQSEVYLIFFIKDILRSKNQISRELDNYLFNDIVFKKEY